MGTPKQVYSDEGGFRANTFFRFMNEAKIKHIQTSTHAHTVERFIITFLDNLYRILDASNQEISDWVKHTYLITSIIIQNIAQLSSNRMKLNYINIIYG